MKIQQSLLLAVGLCSSAFVWASDLINPTTQGQWSNVPDVIAIKTSSDEYSDSDITLFDNIGTGLSGSLSYTINEKEYPNGYTFYVLVADEECKVNGTNSVLLDGEGKGPNIYSVNAQGTVDGDTLHCQVNVDFVSKNPDYAPKLKLQHHQYFDISQAVCGNEGGVGTTQGIPFEIYNEDKKVNEYYFAASASVYNNCAGFEEGIAVYKWNPESEKFEIFDSLIKESLFSVEFFKDDTGTQGNYLVGATFDKVHVWRFVDGEFIEEQSFIDAADDVLSDLEYFKSGDRHFLLTVSLHIDQAAAKTRLYEWKNGKFDTDNPQRIETKHANSATHFNIAGTDYIAIAQLSLPTSPVYRIDPTDEMSPMEFLQNVPTSSATNWEHFKVGSQDYAVVANGQGAKSTVFNWEGQLVDYGTNKVTVADINGWEHLELNGEHYLLSSSSKQLPEIYYWCSEEAQTADHWCANLQGTGNLRFLDEGVDTPDSTIETLRTLEWKSMKIGDDLYVFRMDQSDNNKGEGVQVFKASLN